MSGRERTNANHPPVHVIVYGDPGAGKSTFAATFPKPMLVWHFDPYGKESPYLNRGTPSDVFSDPQADFVREVVSRTTGAMLIRIEYYHDLTFITPEEMAFGLKGGRTQIRIKDMEPDGYRRFLGRMASFDHERDQWATVVVDSTTFMELSARKWDQYVLNRFAEDGRQHYAASKEFLEQMLMMRFAGFPMNVVVNAHIDTDKDELHGTFVRKPALPGKLGSTLAVGYSEYYRAYISKSGEYLLQTHADGSWAAATRIDAPNPCEPVYAALWEAWDEAHAGKENERQ